MAAVLRMQIHLWGLVEDEMLDECESEGQKNTVREGPDHLMFLADFLDEDGDH